MISTFVVGLLSWYCGSIGLIANVDGNNPMEALLFGALISAVDPVATLSIMGNAELKCDSLLYSLVFGESVLNDAIAISLFNVFAIYYDPAGPDWYEANIPEALVKFCVVSFLSILVGVILGLAASAVYKHTDLSNYPNLETSLLFSFCYLCYATGEALKLSGIMSLFFQGMVLSHYNSYNLSPTAHVASEQIFSTLATIAETAVFLYMGMGVFTGRFNNYDPTFTFLALLFCLLGRALNIFPLSWLANLCRSNATIDLSMSSSRNGNRNRSSDGPRKISHQMQCVLWFAGLRGASKLR
jgi:sodium/hydrogen exchanger 8